MDRKFLGDLRRLIVFVQLFIHMNASKAPKYYLGALFSRLWIGPLQSLLSGRIMNMLPFSMR
jgi:hypothetical protein